MNHDDPPDTHPAPPPDDEPTSPGGRTPPPPPPNGDISGAPAWAVRLDRKLDELLRRQGAIEANLDQVVEAFQGHGERITRLENRAIPRLTPPAGLHAVGDREQG